MDSEFVNTREMTIKYEVKDRRKYNIKNSEQSYKMFKLLFDDDLGLDMIECFYAMYLSRCNNVIAWAKLSQGAVHGTVVDPRLVFSYGLNCLASGIIVCHNHPSGQLKPSDSDHKLTTKLVQCGNLMDMSILDHLILSSEGYYSFADEGIL